MSELISRQAAIKDAESWVAVDEHEKHLQKNVVEWLKEFPSAEHGTNLAEVGKDVPDINVGDFISRQAALVAVKDALMAWSYMPEWRDEEILEAIAELPSAQPTSSKMEQVPTRCNLIDRQAAIEKILGQPPEPHYPSWYAEQIRELPPAVPKTGKWIDHRDEGYVECPFCRSATNCDGNIDELHYCFSCGAKMEG